MADSHPISEPIAFTLDGQTVEASPGETILQTARRYGIEIPHLCYKDGLRPDGNCRWRTSRTGWTVGS